MKRRILSLALALGLCLGLLTPALAAEDIAAKFPAIKEYPGYSDVKDGDWFAPHARLCYEVGLIEGSNGAFNPWGQLTIAELATVCARVHEKLSGTAIPEKREDESWYGPYLRRMDALGIDTGDDPLKKATRSDFARMLSSVCGGELLEAINSISALPDTDDANVLRLYNAGILTGTDEYGTFAPTRNLSRAEAATMLSRVVRPSQRERFTLAQRPAAGSLDELTRLLVGMDPDETFATVEGTSVPVKEFLYFLRSTVKKQGDLSGGADKINWDMDMRPHHWNGTLSDYLKSTALDQAVLYAVTEAEAKRAGVGLTDGDKAYLDGYHAYAVETLGGEEAYRRYLFQHCIDEEGLLHLLLVERLSRNLQERCFPAPDETELAAYEAETGILKAKHILVSDKALAEDLLDRLESAGYAQETFDALAEQYSKDSRDESGALAYPAGYVFLPGEMLPDFEYAVKALKTGEMSGIVESGVGFHIILRLPLEADDVLTLSSPKETVREAWSGDRYSAMINAKLDQSLTELDEKAGDAYEGLDTKTAWSIINSL